MHHVWCISWNIFGVVESAKPESRVCKHCTLHNAEEAVVCLAGDEPLAKSETYI